MPESKRVLTLYICPECGKGNTTDAICAHNLSDENESVEVLPLSVTQQLLEAVERIAMMPCENLNGGECPDYWAIGLSKEACASCVAREAVDAARSALGESSE